MKKWTLFIMVVTLLAMPALACGFPFPAGSSMLAVSKAVCAEDEAAESCQERQDAYQMMGKLQSAEVTEMEMAVYIDDGAAITEMSAAGSYLYTVTDSSEGLGANVHATLANGTVNTDTGQQSLDDVEFILLDGVGYTKESGEWTYEELDENTLLGLGMLLGLTGPTGVGFDLYNSPGVFTVEIGPDSEINGQMMHVQTLTFSLEALMMDADALTAMLESSGAGLDMMGLDAAELGDPSQIAMIAMLMLPAFEGSAFSTTIYIGANDGYIHRLEESYIFKMDTGAVSFTEEGDEMQMEMTYSLAGTIANHNAPLTITAPADAQEGEGVLGGLSGGGLGDSLFGN